MSIDKRAMVEAIIEARQKVEKIENDLKLAKDEKLKVEARLIEVLDLTGEKSVKLNTLYGLTLVVRTDMLYVSVNEDDRDKLLQWIDEDCGRNDMIKQSVHNKTLQSFVNQRIKDGEPVPAFIKTYFKPGLSIRNGTKE